MTRSAAFGTARTVLPWLLFAVTVGLIVSSLVGVEVLKGRGPNDIAGFGNWLDIVWLASWVGFPLVGAIIASRRRTVLGWLFLGVGMSIGLAVASSGLVMYQVHVQEVTPQPLLLWMLTAAPALAFGLAPFAFDRFPEDTPPTGRWRFVVATAWTVLTVLMLALTVRPTITDLALSFPNAFAIDALGDSPERVIAVSAVFLTVFFVLVVGRAILRFRRATGVMRAQLKWFVSSLAVFPLLFSIVLVGSGQLPTAVIDALVVVAFFVSFNGMAAAIGIAMFRYRLYDVDRIISRTVGYMLVSVVLAGIYVAGTLGLSAVARAATGKVSDLVVALSTLLVAAAFQPVRQRVQAVVDRRFNRARYDAQRTNEAFSQRLRDQVDLGELRADLTRTVRASLAPSSISVWLPEEVTR